MKMILTEQQVGNLIANIDKSNDTNDIDFEKDAPNLSSFIKNFQGARQPNNPTQKIGINTDLPSYQPEIDNQSIIDTQTLNVMSNRKEMMHPLGHTMKISSKFGLRDKPIAGGTTNHKGVDMPTRSGSPVYAPLDGVVENAEDTSATNACGGFIQLNHGDIKTKFCHLRKFLVNVGDRVKRGQQIGESGGGKHDRMKGIATGPHLHYAIVNKNNVAMNPMSVQPNLG